MKIANQMWLALMLLPMLCACQADDIEGIQEEIPETPTVEVEPVTIKASLPGGDKSRAQVKYGNPNGKAGEFFMWNDDDKITVYNITQNDATGTVFNIGNINGNNADFTAKDGFTADANDILIALYGNDITYNSATSRVEISNTTTQQVKTKNRGDEDLKHLQKDIKMYDILKVDSEGNIPELHFKHLSALMRLTVYNTKEESITLNKIAFSYGINGTFVDKANLSIDKTSLELEAFSGVGNDTWSADMNIELAPHETYDLFFAVLSSGRVVGSDDNLNIRFNGDKNLYINIEGFQEIKILPGYRYWFDLTLTDDGLKETSKLEDYYWYNHPKGESVYVLSSVKDLREFANLVNGTASGVDGAVDFQGKTVTIATGVNTLDLNKGLWTPIGTEDHPFKGTFNGDGCHIANLYVDHDGGYAGLFGYALGTVMNLRVSGMVKSEGDFVGGIAGLGITSYCIFNGKVSGNKYVGGICGKSSSIYECYTTGIVTGKQYVGGIVGYVEYAPVRNCYSAANVDGDYDIGGIIGKGGAEKCYSAGTVTGKNRIGGIAGSFSYASIEHCIALNSEIRIEVTEHTAIGRVVDKTNSNYIISCYAYEGMKAPDGITFDNDASGKDGGNLSAADCLSQTTYSNNSFFGGAPWCFDLNATWEYLPWNLEFSYFRGIQPEDYRIKVPEHLKPAE